MKFRSTLSATTLAVTFALAACSREPRSAAFFEAHPDEARTVVANCTARNQGGAECANAKDGLADFTRKQSIHSLIEQTKAHGG